MLTARENPIRLHTDSRVWSLTKCDRMRFERRAFDMSPLPEAETVLRYLISCDFDPVD